MSRTLHVWREDRHIGVFTAANAWDVRFEYDPQAPEGPISLSLPRDGDGQRTRRGTSLTTYCPKTPPQEYGWLGSPSPIRMISVC